MNGARALWMLAVLLAAAVGAGFVWPRVPKPEPVAPPRLLGGATLAAPIEPYPAWTAAILARPLFSPDRRPTVITATAEAPASQQEPPRLTGILVTPQGSHAIFATAEGERGTIVGEGMRLGPWQVVAIRAGEVQLSGPGGGRIMRPTYSNVPPTASTAAPTANPLLLPQAPGAAVPSNTPLLPVFRTTP